MIRNVLWKHSTVVRFISSTIRSRRYRELNKGHNILQQTSSSKTLLGEVLSVQLNAVYLSKNLCDFAHHHSNLDNENSFVIALKGIPYEATIKDVHNFFKSLNVVPSGVEIQRDIHGRPNGKAIAKFKSYREALKALQKDGKYLGHRHVALRFIHDLPTPHPHHPMKLNMETNKSKDRMTEDHLSRKNITRSFKVRMMGLPFEATEEDVTNFFAPLNITPTAIDIKQRKGRPNGLCNVFFASEIEATTALKNNKKYIGQRYVILVLGGIPAISNSPIGSSRQSEEMIVEDSFVREDVFRSH